MKTLAVLLVLLVGCATPRTEMTVEVDVNETPYTLEIPRDVKRVTVKVTGDKGKGPPDAVVFNWGEKYLFRTEFEWETERGVYTEQYDELEAVAALRKWLDVNYPEGER